MNKLDSHGHKKYKDFSIEEKSKHRERIWGYSLKVKYNLTPAEYYKILEQQNGVCAICEKFSTDRNSKTQDTKLCVDHDHVTGKVRGLLCRECNLKLQIYESLTFIKKADLYLKNHEAKNKES